MADALCHLDGLAGLCISPGWVTANSLCYPDDIPFHPMSSGWLNWDWYLIRKSYGNAIMSSGWDTLPFVSHSDEIANSIFHNTRWPFSASVAKRIKNVIERTNNILDTFKADHTQHIFTCHADWHYWGYGAWKHQIKTFSALLALCEGNHRSPVDSPHKELWRGALMFSLICAWINGWTNNRDAGDLRRHRAHYDVTVMVIYSHRLVVIYGEEP